MLGDIKYSADLLEVKGAEKVIWSLRSKTFSVLLGVLLRLRGDKSYCSHPPQSRRARKARQENRRSFEIVSKISMRNLEYNFETLFKALADRTRLRVIHLIGDDEVCVRFFVAALKTNQPKISRHLAYLRRAGIVAARREGKWMHYRLVEPPDERAAKIFRDVRAGLATNPEMQRDKSRLERIYYTSPALI